VLAWLNRALGWLARLAARSSLVRLLILGAIAAVAAVPPAADFLDLHPAVVILDGLTPLGADNTTYAEHFSNGGFLRIAKGDDESRVRAVLGDPLFIQFVYATRTVVFRKTHTGWKCESNDPSTAPGDFGQIRARYGEPDRELWNYAVPSPVANNYRFRYLALKRGTVVEKVSGYYWD
jgi:hypothetical protein